MSKLVRERNGTPLAPELGYNPVNQYLPPRPRVESPKLQPPSGKLSAAREWVNKLIRK